MDLLHPNSTTGLIMAEEKKPIITIENISKIFPGVKALDQVNLKFYEGEVHAVIGENGAGKSTMMNLLAGEIQPDEGTIYFQGKPVKIPHPNFSHNLGIKVVYQELALCPNLTIAENISLNTICTEIDLSMVKREKFMETARTVLANLGVEGMDVNRPVGSLTVAEQQMIEIAKAISMNVKVLVLDEPNSAFTYEETQHLFKVIRQLAQNNVAVIYVSHRLEEVLEICDRISVLRDGKMVGETLSSDSSVDGLISMMVGREVDDLYKRSEDHNPSSRVLLEVKDLSTEDGVKKISFKVHQGEILGFAGLPDSYKDTLIETCMGLHKYTGEIKIKEIPAQLVSPADAIDHHLAFIPADRRGSGSIPRLDVKSNIITSSLGSVSRSGILNPRKITEVCNEYVGKMNIKISTIDQLMGTLSGGNQQKVILARGLATDPTVLLLHEPTRGIDVAAKAEIYNILQQLAKQDFGVIIVSSEIAELIGQCDRILVMHEGNISGEFDRKNAAEEPILACAMGQYQ
jgi:ABC-type sugar transport system ATPase subunit